MLLSELPSLNIPLSQLLIAVGVILAVGLLFATMTIYATNRKNQRRSRRHWLVRGMYVIYLILIGVLGVTAFGSIMQFGHVGGYALLFHVTAAGAFVFLMIAIAFWFLPNRGEERNREGEPIPGWWAVNWSAWALVFSSLLAAGTMLLSMLPLLDTQGLLQMAAVHRYAGLAVVVSAVLHAYSLICMRLGWR